MTRIEWENQAHQPEPPIEDRFTWTMAFATVLALIVAWFLISGLLVLGAPA